MLKPVSKNQSQSENKLNEKRLCPFTRDPYDECFIIHTESKYTESIIKFCGGNYEECEIYKRNLKGKNFTKWNVLI
jgi:hypothetical protein